MIKENILIILGIITSIILLSTFSSAKLDFSNPFFPKLTNDKTSSILFSQITGTDYNGCTGTNKVTNVSFVNGDLQIICATDEIGGAGTGDITSVQGDTYITNGADAGAVNLIFNETKLNQTIDNRDSDTTYSAGSNLSLIGTIFSLNGTSLKNWLDTLYQTIGSSLLVSDLPLTNRTISHWNNITNKPANLDIDSTNDLLITDLPLHNRTLVNCANITGATSNLCTITSSGTGLKDTDGIYVYDNGTRIFFNQTKENITINSLIDLDELHYNQTTPAIDYYKSNPAGYYNVTTLPASSGNASWNQSLANTLYSSIIWNYNQTTPFTNWLSTFVYNYNQTTPAITYANNNFNYTSILNNLTSTDCPAGQLVIGVQNNGTVLCVVDSQGTTNASFNQSLTDTLYANIKWGYNMTSPFTNWLSTFLFNYNQTTPANTYTDSQVNKSWNESRANLLYAPISVTGDNSSWNQSLADSLYYSKTNPAGYYNVTTLPSSSASIGYYINYTPITTTGNITNGTFKGYLAANQICSSYYSGSHMCQTGEILNSINRNQSNQNFTATFWISEGAPGYLSESYDCSGLTTSASASLGSIWVGSTSHINTFGTGGLVTCSASRAIGCCI